MKRFVTKYIFLFAAMISLVACKDDSTTLTRDITVNTQVVGADEEVGVTIKATLGIGKFGTDVDFNTDVETVYLNISEKSDMSGQMSLLVAKEFDRKDTIYCVVPGLKRDTKYFYSYTVSNYMSSYTTDVKSFNIDKNFNLSNVWSEVAPFKGGLRSGGVAFALDGKGYYGLGKSSMTAGSDKYWNDLWKFDPVENEWFKLSDFPSTGLDMCVAFVIGNVAYVTLGRYSDIAANFNGYNTTTYAYDLLTDSWTKLEAFPSVGRTGSASFELNGKGYIVCGYREKYKQTNEVWCYDPILNKWNQKNDFPLALTGCYTFTLASDVYVGGGYDEKHVGNTTLFRYSEDTDTWSVAATDCEPLIYSSGFSGVEKAYVAGGEGEIGGESLFMSFNGKDWATLGSFGGIRKKSASFVIDDSFYLVCGDNDVNIPQQSVLKYTFE